AGFEYLQGDTTAILDLVKGIVSTLSAVSDQLQALETQIARSLPPPTSSKPAVMPAMFRSLARTQEELEAREAELEDSEVYDVVLLAHMRRWFRNARDRAGGRTKRITKPPKSKDVDLDDD
ncbi:hypothetical protein EG68_04214, partial [Paragonimus skrjabini miyazakii]